MEQLDLFSFKPKARKHRSKAPQEFKVVALNDAPASHERILCETPEDLATYWRSHIATASWYRTEQECFVAIFLNKRRRILGHHLITLGLVDQVLAHPRETFRAAIVLAAYALVVAHNHPSGDPTPSEADIKITRKLVRAGEFLSLEVVDHVIIGNPNHVSLRSLGHFL